MFYSILLLPKAIYCQQSADDISWDNRFTAPGILGNNLRYLTDSTGSIYVGGYCTYIDDQPINGFAKWDGHTWMKVCERILPTSDCSLIGLDSIYTYAMGQFVTLKNDTIRGYAKWNGTDWSSFAKVPKLFVHYYDGKFNQASIKNTYVSNGKLILTGDFDSSENGQRVGAIVRWEGDRWLTFNGGITRDNKYDGPSINTVLIDGEDIFVGGNFQIIGGTSCKGVSRWSFIDSTWHPLGLGITAVNYGIECIVRQGKNFLIGGEFNSAGGKGIANLALWDGSAWYPIGNPKDVITGKVLNILPDGNLIHIEGILQKVGKQTAFSLATWDGNTWSTRFDFHDSILANYNRPPFNINNSYISAMGNLMKIKGKYYGFKEIVHNSSCLWQWHDSIWQPIISGKHLGVANAIFSLAVKNDTSVFAGGSFNTLDGKNIKCLANWDGKEWNRVGKDSIDGWIFTILLRGDSVFIGGNFTIRGRNISNVAVWDGNSWNSLGGGIEISVNSLYVLNNILYAGGDGLVGSYYGIQFVVERLTSNGWGQFGPSGDSRSWARSTRVLSSDFNNNLIAGGDGFCQVFRGNEWRDLDTSFASGYITTIVKNENYLYIGGSLGNNSGIVLISKNGFIRFDSILGQLGPIALDVRNDTDIYAIGSMYIDANHSVRGVGHFDGKSWKTLGSGIDYNDVYSIISSSNEVFVGGSFTMAGSLRSSGFAIWHIPSPSSSVIKNIKADDEIFVYSYPNPAHQQINIKIISNRSQYIKLSIYDPLGRKLQSIFEGIAKIGIKDYIFSAGKLSNGIYLFSLQTENNNYQTKLVVTH